MLRKNNFPNDPSLDVKCMNCQIKKKNQKYERERKNRSTAHSDGSTIII